MINCCVPRCLSSLRKADSSVSFHAFPSNPDVATKWIRSINLYIPNGGTWFPQTGNVVCSKHFSQSDFKPHMKTPRLKPGSVPSVFESSFSSKPSAVSSKSVKRKKTASISPLIVKVIKPAEEDSDDTEIDDAPLSKFNGRLSSKRSTSEDTSSNHSHKMNFTKVTQPITKKIEKRKGVLLNNGNTDLTAHSSSSKSKNEAVKLHSDVLTELVNNSQPVIHAMENESMGKTVKSTLKPKKKDSTTDLIEIGASTFSKINPDVFKVTKRITPSGMDWCNETVLEFLDLFESEPIIWNPSFPNHKNRNEVHDAWKRIEIKMGQQYSVTELKKKKDSLMASFRTCMKKIKDSIESGVSADEVYRPNWFAFAKMVGFLRDKDAPRETFCSEAIQSENDDKEHEDDLQNMVPPEDCREVTNTNRQNDAVVMPSGSQDASKNSSRKRRKYCEEDELRKKMDTAYSILQSTLCKPAKDKHVCDIYGELVAVKLKAMDERSREICMRRLDNVLYETKMNISGVTSEDSPCVPKNELLFDESPSPSSTPPRSFSDSPAHSPSPRHIGTSQPKVSQAQESKQNATTGKCAKQTEGSAYVYNSDGSISRSVVNFIENFQD